MSGYPQAAMPFMNIYRSLNTYLAGQIISQLTDVAEQPEERLDAHDWARHSASEVDDPVSKIQLAEDLLRKAGLVRMHRPESAEEFRSVNDARESDPWYVFEWLPMTPIHLPRRKIGDSFTPELTVWVADPVIAVEERESAPAHAYIGSFLFLVQEAESLSETRFVSGISALRFLVDFVAHPDEMRMTDMFDARAEEDRYGRWETAHPIEKLESVGGLPGRPRSIASIYRIGVRNV